VSLENWMSTAQEDCVRNLVAFVTYGDQMQIVFFGCPEFWVTVRSAPIASSS